MALALVGCGGGKPKAQTPAKREKPIFGSQVTVNTAPGEALARSIEGARDPLYRIRWESAKIRFSDKGIFAGSMETVTGEMYDKGVVASTFKADHAIADRDTQVLTLKGGIRVESKQRRTVLTCATIEWHAKEKIVKAIGNVLLKGSLGTVGPAKEMWATPDLKTIATPDMFKSS